MVAAPAADADTATDEGEYVDEESEGYEGPTRPSNLSPIRLRMGWRRNNELEVRTSDMQRALDMLRPITEALTGNDDPAAVKASKAEYDKGRKQRQAESRSYDDLILEESEATGLARAYAKSVVSYFAMHPQAKEEGVTVKHLHSMLDDLVDRRVVEQRSIKGLCRKLGGQVRDRRSFRRRPTWP